MYLAGHCLQPYFPIITSESIGIQTEIICNQMMTGSSTQNKKYNHLAIPFLFESPEYIREYLLDNSGKLEMVFGKSRLKPWSNYKYWRVLRRYPYMLTMLKSSYLKDFRLSKWLN